jgi:quercetin dioxygenase-like cupin family protein
MNAPVNISKIPAWWWFGELATLKLASKSTHGGLSVFEILAPAGLIVPRHIHHLEDEIFVILDGAATFIVGKQTIDAVPGDTLFGPRGVAHGYTVGPKGCRMLFAFTPGSNMESFVAASAVPALAPTLPPSEVMPPAPEVLGPILSAHGLAFA